MSVRNQALVLQASSDDSGRNSLFISKCADVFGRDLSYGQKSFEILIRDKDAACESVRFLFLARSTGTIVNEDAPLRVQQDVACLMEE